jgi:hypothetical protein
MFFTRMLVQYINKINIAKICHPSVGIIYHEITEICRKTRSLEVQIVVQKLKIFTIEYSQTFILHHFMILWRQFLITVVPSSARHTAWPRCHITWLQQEMSAVTYGNIHVWNNMNCLRVGIEQNGSFFENRLLSLLQWRNLCWFYFRLRRHNVINFAELRPDREDDSCLVGPTSSPPVIGPSLPKFSLKKTQRHILSQRNLVHNKMYADFTFMLIVYLYLSQGLESGFCPVSCLANDVGVFLSFFFLSFFLFSFFLSC